MSIFQHPYLKITEQDWLSGLSSFQREQHFKLTQLASDLLKADWSKKETQTAVIKNIQVIDYFQPEGYWRSNQNSDNMSSLPWPMENIFSEEDLNSFLLKLDFVEERIKNKKFYSQKSKTDDFSYSEYMSNMGHSTCRCCGNENGNKEYIFKAWKWPEGYRHYLIEHKVTPTDSFMSLINNTYSKYHIDK